MGRRITKPTHRRPRRRRGKYGGDPARLDQSGARQRPGNGSDQVGRNYMFHTMSALVSVTPTRFEAAISEDECVNDFYWNDPAGGFDYPMGHIQLLEHMDGMFWRARSRKKGVSAFPIPDALSNAAAERMLAFLCISEDLPGRGTTACASMARISASNTRTKPRRAPAPHA